MHNDVISKPSASDTTCRIAPPVDERFDDEAFLRREMAEAKAAVKRTVATMKDHGARELRPQEFVRRHPLAAAGACGLGGLWLVRRLFGRRRGKSRRDARPAEAPAKVGLLAMLVPAVVGIVQSLSAAKLAGAQASPTNPRAWMVRTLWGLARNRFRSSRDEPAAMRDAAERYGLKAVGSRTPAPEPTRDRRVKPR